MAAAVETPVVSAPASSITEPLPVQGSLAEQLASELPFNPEEIKKRYLAERDKRLRKDGNEQYKEFKGQFQHYLVDPYTPLVEREPVDVETDFVVVGGGFGGLCLAARLVEAGITDIKVVEKGGGFGGTWYFNRYPGAACDIGKFL
jgi:cyclohexanone monooxygenase